MKKTTQGLYQAREFAELSGVTVRTLHHYDRLGLLKPDGRTAAGYRLYGERDLARLQQIVTLKFIGFSLKQIKALLERDRFDLRAALGLQREIIMEKRCHLDLAVKAIEKAEAMMASGEELVWDAFKKIIEVINMQNDVDWMNKYYTEEARQKLAQHAPPREVIEQVQRDWAALIKEVESMVAQGEDPASDKAQALASRWASLINAFTGGDPEIAEGLKKLYADKSNWPSTFQKPYSDEVGAFICEAVALRDKK